MSRSLLLVGGFAVLVVVLGASRALLFPTGRQAERVKVVSYAGQATAAHRLAPADAATPAGLPATWRATSARFLPHGSAYDLHIGFVTPAGDYAALEETTGAPAPFLADQVGRVTTRLPPAEVAGLRWELRRTAGGELVLLRTHGRATVLVTGSAGLAELRVLAASLR